MVDPATVCGWALALMIAPFHLAGLNLEAVAVPEGLARGAPTLHTSRSAGRPGGAEGPGDGCVLPGRLPGPRRSHPVLEHTGESPARAEPPPVRAVVDRIVDGVAALLRAGPVELELHVSADTLPDGATDGSWVILDVIRGIAALDHVLTEQRTQELGERLAAIRRQRTGGRFPR